jgi:hypothetical protein
VKEREGGEGTSSFKIEVKSYTILPLIHLERHPRTIKQTSFKLELEVTKQKRSWNTVLVRGLESLIVKGFGIIPKL